MNLAEWLAIPADVFPTQEIVVFDSRRITYDALRQGVSLWVRRLRRLGVAAGDRVAVLDVNTPAFVETLYATASLGAVFVPLNYRARADELGHMLTVAAPKVLLAGERYLPAAASVVASLGVDSQVVPLNGTDGDAPRPPVQEGEVACEEVSEDDLAVLMFTSGTTAAAKAVMLSHGSLSNFVLSASEMADGSDRGTVLIAAPLYHIAGLTAVLAATFAGRRMVLMRQFGAEEWLRLVAEERVTHAFLVPTMVKRVLDHLGFPHSDLSSLQVLSYGAAPMPLAVIRRAIERFPHSVQFINAFGQTETTSTVTMLGPDDHRLDGTPEEIEKKLRRLASIGRPVPEVELLVLDEQGRPLPPGQLGEIAIRSDRTMQGYYGQEEATHAALAGDLLRTRDLGWVDEDGYLFLAGRKSDMIIRGGENIAPEEVEMVLGAHPVVEEAAVIGLPDQEWGERVAAVVVRRQGAQVSESSLIEFCRQRLASFKKPEVVYFAEALPRNGLGKVLRKDLRALYAGTTGSVGTED